MTMAITTYLRAIAFAFALQQAVAQTCYYPNGNPAPGEKPCSSAEGSACCPDKWQCMDNGLCYYEPDDLYGRYSCTDKEWESSGCPSNMCTYGLQAAGGEAVSQCSNHNNQWCCDANRVDVDCCQEKPQPRPFFNLQDPVAYGTAGGSTGSSVPDLAAITGLASGSGNASPSTTAPSTSPSVTRGSSSGTTQSSSSTPSSVTSESTMVTTNSQGGLTTLVVTTIIQPSATSTGDPASSTEKKSKIPLIVGCAAGIPLGLAFIGVLFWLFRKQRQQKASKPYTSTDAFTPQPGSPEFAGGAKLQKNGNNNTTYAHNLPNTSELDSQGVGPQRPISFIPGKAEMDSGGAFAPGSVPHSPHVVGLGGGNGNTSNLSVPPSYSSDSPTTQNRFSTVSSMGDSPAGPQGYATGGYTAYRPPAANNMSEIAELPADSTQPAPAAELGIPSPPAVAETEAPGPPGHTGRENPKPAQQGGLRVVN